MAVNIAADWVFPASPRAMLVVQSIYAGLLALIVFAIARRFGDERLGVAAAALALTHPALLYYDVRKLHPLGFDSLMMMLAVWLLMRLRGNVRPSAALSSGIALGFAIFQRGSMALFLVGAVAWLAFWSAPDAVRRREKTAGIVLAYLAGVAIVITPWAARNYAIHHTVLLESMTSQQFWKGNATYSNGSGYLADGRNVYDAAPPRLVAEWRRRDEIGQFRLFRDEGLAEIRKDPGRAAALVMKKFVYFWTVPPNSGQEYPRLFYVAYLAYYALVVFFGFAGLSAAWARPEYKPDVTLVIVYLTCVAVVHALMFVEMRHRWATEPMLLAFAPCGARALWVRLALRRTAT